MESKYDRVAYPDNVCLHSDPEQEEFGTGVYPGVSIISRNKRRKDTIKIACFRIQRKFTMFLVIGMISIIFLICLIVVLSTTDRSYSNDSGSAGPQTVTPKPIPNYNDKEFGLFFQPQKGSSSEIRFDPVNINSYRDYLNLLDFHMHDYNKISQLDSHLVNCSDGKPPAKDFACKLPASEFGDGCTHLSNYGFVQGRPCVLLTLSLNNSLIPVPFTQESNVAKNILKRSWSQFHVGVTCDGETEEDRKQIVNNVYVSHDGRREGPIDIQPAKGFSTAFFPNKSEKYVKPAVMVQFNGLLFNRYVNIQCVAWASNFNGGQPQSSKIYSAKFQLYIGK